MKFHALAAVACLTCMRLAAADGDFAILFGDASLHTDTARVQYWRVALRTEPALETHDRDIARTTARFEVVDIDAGSIAANVTGAAVTIDNASPRFIVLRLREDALDPKHQYLVIAAGLQYQGKALKPLTVPLAFPAAASGGTATPTKAPLTLSKVAKRDDADLYISGELDTVSKVQSPDDHKVNAIADIDVGYKFYQKFWGHEQTFKPNFTLNASSEKDHDPNSMTFGVRWDTPLRWTWVRWRKEPKVESTKNFSESDAITATSLRFLPRDWHGVYLTPYVGGEFGGTFKSRLPEARGRAIVRGLIGTELDFNHDLKQGIKSIGVSANYVRRFLARSEVAVDDTDASDLELLRFGRTPHDHVEAKLKIGVSDLFAVTIGYERGDLPPAYSRLYNQVKIGLLFQAAVN